MKVDTRTARARQRSKFQKRTCHADTNLSMGMLGCVLLDVFGIEKGEVVKSRCK